MAEVRAELPLNFHLVKLQDNICQAKSPSFFSPNIYLGGTSSKFEKTLKNTFCPGGSNGSGGFDGVGRPRGSQMVRISIYISAYLSLQHPYQHVVQYTHQVERAMSTSHFANGSGNSCRRGQPTSVSDDFLSNPLFWSLMDLIRSLSSTSSFIFVKCSARILFLVNSSSFFLVNSSSFFLERACPLKTPFLLFSSSSFFFLFSSFQLGLSQMSVDLGGIIFCLGVSSSSSTVMMSVEEEPKIG